MLQYNYPTTILFGQGALAEFANRLKAMEHRKVCIVTDRMIVEHRIAERVTSLLSEAKIDYVVFAEVHPNPVEEDVEKGLEAFRAAGCDALIGLGGGSPLDVAKVIKIMAVNPPPLAQYDDARGGDRLIRGPMPPLYAIPTTAGTGSEVGRSGVIIMRETGRKTIFFHPSLLPSIAVLEPELTAGLPPHLTAATGMDAFVHCLEAYLVNMFHPMADGIALQGMELIVAWLPEVCRNGGNLLGRERMQIASAMGATAFQKGLGMIHSMAHPLSSLYGMHHGLANALLLPASMRFIENANLNEEQRNKLARVRRIFADAGMSSNSLADCCAAFCNTIGITLGLSRHGVPKGDVNKISEEAMKDSCHTSNICPVSVNDFKEVLASAM